jgi:hypothetical protein
VPERVWAQRRQHDSDMDSGRTEQDQLILVIEDEAQIRQFVRTTASFSEITRIGMDLVGADSARAARIREAHQTIEWMAQVFANAPPMPSSKRSSPLD